MLYNANGWKAVVGCCSGEDAATQTHSQVFVSVASCVSVKSFSQMTVWQYSVLMRNVKVIFERVFFCVFPLTIFWFAIFRFCTILRLFWTQLLSPGLLTVSWPPQTPSIAHIASVEKNTNFLLLDEGPCSEGVFLPTAALETSLLSVVALYEHRCISDSRGSSHLLACWHSNDRRLPSCF